MSFNDKIQAAKAGIQQVGDKVKEGFDNITNKIQNVSIQAKDEINDKLKNVSWLKSSRSY